MLEKLAGDAREMVSSAATDNPNYLTQVSGSDDSYLCDNDREIVLAAVKDDVMPRVFKRLCQKADNDVSNQYVIILTNAFGTNIKRTVISSITVAGACV